MTRKRNPFESVYYPKRGKPRRAAARRTRSEPGKMNKTEQAYSEVLNQRIEAGEVISWRYEPLTFRLAKRTTITPDFWVVMADGSIEIHEVKACNANGSYRIEDDAAVKIKCAAEEYREFRWLLCGLKPKRIGAGWRIEEVGT